MDIIKKIAIGVLLFLALILIDRYGDYNNNIILKVFVITFTLLFIFNLSVRKMAWFKPYYTSRFNFLTTNFRTEKEYDLSTDLLFHKIIEVLMNSGLSVFYSDEDKGVIMATSSLTWFSWGENIYIKLTDEGNVTKMEFCSSTLFGIYDWGKNQKNYDYMLAVFDDSLTI